MTRVAPYGSWRSPITARSLVEQAVGLSQIEVDEDRVLWSESRPSEGGRQVLVSTGPAGEVHDLLEAPFSARTLVHEYGGRCFAASGGLVVFTDMAGQRLWRIMPEGKPAAVTALHGPPRSVRFADPVITPDGRWVICVRERHEEEVLNDLVAVPLGQPEGMAEPMPLAGGHDFFAAPRLSPDGTRLAWLSWDHPDMPWDHTDLWVAEWSPAGQLGAARRVAGGDGDSISQPRWSGAGRLHYASDRTGWWNLYDEDGRALAPLDAEFSAPDWLFGQSTYAFLPDGRLVASWSADGAQHLGIVEGRSAVRLDLPFTSYAWVQPAGSAIVAVAGSPTSAPAVVRIHVDTRQVEVLRRSHAGDVDPGYLSTPRPIEFPTEGARTAHALYYPPANRDFEAPATERPPLVVMSHGGPTSATSSDLNLGVQYWTSRGLAVVDVDYGGSSGYGREYRRRLCGAWGEVDVDDCVNAAGWLAGQGLVDGRRMVIRGRSAGGYTTLCALTFRRLFAAGASHFGVADLELLARDTHKFEARYLDRLVGPYPEAADAYRRRSPIHHVESISCPVILFQGLDDPVVPPAQAELIFDGLRRRGVPVAYLAFEGEQHGFRSADTIMRVADAELAFYGRVLGFDPADEVAPFEICNEGALAGRDG